MSFPFVMSSLMLAQAFTSSASSVLPRANASTLTNSTDCAPVHIMAARGSTEGYPGLLGTLSELVLANTTGANYEAIIYPAVDETTTDSYFVGRQAAADQLSSYVEKCPDSKIVLLAYSQGALIVADALAGGGGDSAGILGNATAPLVSSDVGSHIAAFVMYGDPRHVPNQVYDFATTNTTGKYPRLTSQIDVLSEDYSCIIADYCNGANEPVCSAGNDIALHEEYAPLFDTTAAAFVAGKLA